MACKVGTFTKATSTGNQSVTGVGFQPKALILWTTRQTSEGQTDIAFMSYGFSDGTRSRCSALNWRDQSGLQSDTSESYADTAILRLITNNVGSTTIDAEASVVSFDADGFTLNWSIDDGAASIIHYAAIGGGAEAVAGSFNSPTSGAPGQHAYTGVGFQPDLLLFICPDQDQENDADYTDLDSVFTLGATDASGNQWVTSAQAGNAGNGARSYQSTSACVALIESDSSIDELASFVSMDADGFTLNWSVVAGSPNTVFYLALRTVNARVGSLTQPTSTGTQAITGLSLTPEAVMFLSQNKVATAAADDGGRMSIGAGDGTSQGCAWVGMPYPQATAPSARSHQTTNAIRTLTPHATGSSSVITSEAELTTLDEGGFTLDWTTVDAIARQILYVAFASGTDEGVDFENDNHQSGEFIGLTWVEFYHVDSSGANKTYLWAPVDLIDPSTYYGGYKEPRILNYGDITRALSDARGQYEVAEWSWTQSDTDRLVRGLLGTPATKNVLNRPVILRMIDDASRRLLLKPRVLARGVIRHYQPKGPLLFEWTAKDFLASKFGAANLEKQIPQRTITRVDFPDCPIDTAGKPVPIVYGHLSDASSSNPPPVLTGTTSRGSFIDDGTRVFGFGDLTSDAAVPTGLSINAAAGGSLSIDVPDSKYGVWVTAIDSDGNESDPDCFYTDQANNGARGTFPSVVQTTTVTAGQKIEASWSAAAGAAKYRAYLAYYYFGARATQYIEVTAPTTSCEFTDNPNWETVPTVDTITSGANLISWSNRYQYAVSANYADGETGLSSVGFCSFTGQRREFRVEWVAPTVAPTSYYVYRRTVGVGTWDRRWTVPVGTTVFDDDNLDTNVTYINGAPLPTGAVPLTYVGSVADLEGFIWQRFLLAGHAVKEITDLYQNFTKIDPDNYGVTFAVPGKTGYSTFFANTGNPQYMTINGHRYACVMVRGPQADLAVSGEQPLTANVKGIESTGDGTGTLLTSIADIYKHLVINWLFQSYDSGSWLTAPNWDTDVDGTVTSQVDEDSFDAVEDIHEARLSGGYPGAIMFGAQGESITLREAIARMNLSADCQSGFNRHSQFFVTAIDYRAAALDDLINYSQVNDIVQQQFDLDPATSKVENVVVYSFRKRYAPIAGGTEWDWQDQELRDEDAITDLREERKSQALELHAVRSTSVAQDIVTRRLEYYKEPPVNVTVTTNLRGLSTELGDLITVTHIGGISEDGWTDRVLRVMRHITNPDDYRVRLECVDVDRLYRHLPASYPGWLPVTSGSAEGVVSDEGTVDPFYFPEISYVYVST